MYKNSLIYARFSNERKDDSLERMVSELKAYAAELRIPVAEVISEDDVSAWTHGSERKGRWPDVVAGLADRTYDCLIVRSLDRCARDMVETIKLAQLRDSIGFGFYALNGDTLGDELLAALIGWKNSRESKDKSDRLKLKWAAKASKGDYHPGRWRPYGYQYVFDEHGVRRGLAVDPTEAETVREVTARLITGESAHAIAIELERRGISTVSGSQWQRMMVIRLVKPVSAGLIAHNGEVMPGNHPPIISEEEYWQVRAAIKKGDTPLRGHNARKHLLAGMIFCSRCGCVMQCNGRVYQCSTKNTRAGIRGCGRITVTKTHIEELIVSLTLAYLNRQDLEVERQVSDDWSPAITAAEQEQAAIQAAYEAGEITASQWLAGLKVARQKLASATQGRSEQLAKLTGANLAKMAGSDAKARWDELNLSQRRAVLGELFEAIIIKPGVKGCPIFKPERVELIWRTA